MAIGQIAEHGEFLRTDDQGLLAAQAFVGAWFPYFGPDGLRYLPFPGNYRDQPAELMEILPKIGKAIRKAPLSDD